MILKLPRKRLITAGKRVKNISSEINAVSGAYGQGKHPFGLFLESQFSATANDRTKPNNPFGMGPGLRAVFSKGSTYSLTETIALHAYFPNDKVYRTNTDGTEKKTVDFVIRVLTGIQYVPVKNVFISFTGGPAFISGQVLAAINPSLGVYLTKKKKWEASLGYSNIFNRDSGEKQNFSSIQFSLGFGIF
jgi:hypothetical protein